MFTYVYLLAFQSGFWNKIEGDSESHQQQSRDSLRDIYKYLEDPAADAGAGKQRDPSLTPDVESQTFMGDLMQGNSYLTQRIPSNWRDPE